MKPQRWKSTYVAWLSQVVPILLGLLLVVAATSKAVFLRAGASMGADSLFRSPFILASVVFAEFVIGIWFLVLPGFFPRLTRAVGAGFFGLLACFSGYAVLTGEECHCFGTWQVPAVAVFAIDLVAVAFLVSLPLRCRPDVSPYFRVRWRLSAFAGAVLFCALPVSIWAGSYAPSQLSDVGVVVGDSRLVVLEPREWVGKRFPLEPYADLPTCVMKGEWLVALHSRDCLHCRKILPQLTDLVKNESSDHQRRRHLALIDILPPLGKGKGNDVDSAQAQIVHSHLTYRWKWFAKLPIGFWIQNGIVREICADEERLVQFAQCILSASQTTDVPANAPRLAAMAE